VSFGQGSFADDDSFGQESSLADESFVGRSLERGGEQDKDFMHFSFNNLASLLQRNLELAGEATAKAKLGDTQRGTQLHPQPPDEEPPDEAAAKAPIWLHASAHHGVHTPDEAAAKAPTAPASAPAPPPHSAAVPVAEAPPATTPATMSDPSASNRSAAAEADGDIPQGNPAIVPRTAAPLFVPSPPGQRRKTVYSLNGFDRQSGFHPKGQTPPPQGEPPASGSPM
jgi:hypothetical protein